MPVHDDRLLFEMLNLEGAQAGLSWLTILRKRDGYRKAFANFDAKKVARFSESKQAALLTDAGIVRHRQKIAAVVTNAKAVLRVQRELGSFDAYVWEFVGGTPIVGGIANGGEADRGADEQRSQAPRLRLRRTHHLLRIHAGGRADR